MRIILITLVAQCAMLSAAASAVFEQGEADYACFRIPAIIRAADGALVAFAEARRGSCSDTGFIDLVAKRSTDNGATWGEIIMVVEAGDGTSGNPAPVVDRENGRILLPITRNHAEAHESKILRGTAPHRTVWFTYSDDHGLTWAAPRDISAETRMNDWRWYATGPCHAIQLESGRFLVPANHSKSENHEDWHSHVIYSDDAGATWRIGGVHTGYTNESTVAQLRDGRIYQNMRSYKKKNRRQVSWSADGGETWSPAMDDAMLIEPVCQASVLAIEGDWGKDPLLFSNPASTNRDRMTIRMSVDGGATWPHAKLIHAGPAAYSDLVQLDENTVGLLYERGEESPYETITFETVAIEAIRSNAEEN